jgi:hypothetical protein
VSLQLTVAGFLLHNKMVIFNKPKNLNHHELETDSPTFGLWADHGFCYHIADT